MVFLNDINTVIPEKPLTNATVAGYAKDVERS
jgi:hypothetical protein